MENSERQHDADDAARRRRAQSLLEVLYHSGDYKALQQALDQAKDSGVKDYAAGLLMRPWLPWGAARRMLMLAITLAAVLLATIYRSAFPLLLLLLNVFFSPRAIGETIAFLRSR